jgi:flagellar basal body-associated protein FliL
MDKKTIIIFIIIAVVVFLFGGVGGFFLRASLFFSQEQKAQTNAQTVKILSSKTISSVSFYGVINNIQNRDITFSNAGDTITIVVKEGAPIYLNTTDDEGKKIQQKINLNELKQGDKINLGAKVLEDGALQGQSVIVLP